MTLADKAPDVARENIPDSVPIDFSGIQDLQAPVQITKSLQVRARVNLFVSLDASQRGIHMSRMYQAFHQFCSKEVLSFEGLKQLLLKIVREQKESSQSGRIRVSSEWPVERTALISGASGWRYYPFFYEVTYREDSFDFVLGGEILYSSTCPCSAALSRQIISNQFDKQFSGEDKIDKAKISEWLTEPSALAAVPHGQKSCLSFRLLINPDKKDEFSFLKFVDEMEAALTTPVQTFVKREDEAEFARLNGENLMFCEDAIRRAAQCLNKQSSLLDYFAQARHYESLHPFQVESALVKGVPGGWRV